MTFAESVIMTILYCDDDRDDVEAFSRAVRTIDSSIECVIAYDGTDGLDMLFIQELKPDAIFVDLHMPKMDGLEFVVAVKRNNVFKSIPVIILASSIEKKHIEQFNKMGVYHFLSKSTVEEELSDALKSILFCSPAHRCLDVTSDSNAFTGS